MNILRRPLYTGFSPTEIAGIHLWLKADGITGLNDGDSITTWSDSSGNSRDATQSNSSQKPTYQTNEQNGLPIVRFDGSDDTINTATFTTLTQPFTMFFVCKIIANTYVIDSDSNLVNIISYVPAGNYLRFNAGLNVQYPDSLPIGYGVFTALANGASSVLRKDGVQKDAANAGSNSMSQLFIGSAFNGTACSQTDFAEIILYSGDKTSNFSVIEGYLKTKWGTP